MGIDGPTYHDFFTWVTEAMSHAIDLKDVFAYWVQVAVFPSIVVIKVAQLGVYKALLHRGWEDTVQRFALLVMLLAGHLMAIQFWTRPFPGTSTTLPGALNETADLLEQATIQGSFDRLVADIEAGNNRVGIPVVDNISGQFSYYVTRAVMVGFELVAFGVTLLAYGGFAVGVALGPLAIPMALFSRTAGWFDRWLTTLIKYAMMRVVAAIVLGIVTLLIHRVFAAIPWYVYILSLEKALLVIVAAIAACLYFTFKIPAMTAEYFGGGEGLGGLGSWVASTATAIVRFAALS
jgi:type IV secretory pathway VirB6-like protein